MIYYTIYIYIYIHIHYTIIQYNLFIYDIIYSKDLAAIRPAGEGFEGDAAGDGGVAGACYYYYYYYYY